MSAIPCDQCHGRRLSPESLSVTVGGINISEFCDKSITEALEFVNNLQLTEREMFIAASILKEIKERLGFFKQRWFGIFNAVTFLGNTFRRRKPTNSFGNTNWFFSQGLCCTFWTNQVLDCIKEIMINCWNIASSA